MRTVRLFLALIFVLITKKIVANDFPFVISKVYSENQITKYQGQKLILLDFWATWCGPCRPATEQLEILQEQVRDEVFIVSITDEKVEALEKYMSKHPIRLMVILDDGYIFKKYNIRNRPSSILLNTDGEVIWKGHPAGIDIKKIKYYARKHEKSENISLDNIFIRPSVNLEKIFKKSVNTSSKSYITRSSKHQETFVQTENSIKYTGSLYKLLAKVLDIPQHLIQSKNITDFFVDLDIPTQIWKESRREIITLIERDLSIKIKEEIKTEEVFEFDVINNQLLWDTEQIDWGQDNPNYFLIGEERIEADNITIKELCRILSNAKKKIYDYTGANRAPYDWNVHYLYDNLMEAELSDTFGITMQKKKKRITYYKLHY